jgi:hypothetical protein
MRFEKDILISYAHIDDAPLVEGQKGWISEFHRSLEIRLAQVTGRKPVIWRDPKLQGNDFFGDEIVSQFPDIAMLISILSPRYVKSDWCVKEVNEFVKASDKNLGVRVDNKSRIFKVIKTPVHRSEHPPVIKDVLGYEFYQIDQETGRPKEFGRIFGGQTEQEYWQRIDDLAYDIRDLLDLISRQADKAQTPEEKDKPAIYLAETTSDLKEHRESIRRDLQQHGYRILPEQNLPLTDAELRTTVDSLLSQCVLSVHLIGSRYGVVPEGSEKSIHEIQNELVAAKSIGKKLKRLIWLIPNSQPEDARQRNFVRLLMNDSDINSTAELLQSSLEEVKAAIHEKLKKEQEKEEKQEPDEADPTGPARIYLICDQKDLESGATRVLEDHLFDRGFDVILPVFEGDETQVRLDHQENLKTCDGVLVFYGQGNELWLRSKLRDFLKVAGYGRSKPLEPKAVYISGPADAGKERYRSHEVIVINGLSGFDPSQLADFEDKVNHGRKTTTV